MNTNPISYFFSCKLVNILQSGSRIRNTIRRPSRPRSNESKRSGGSTGTEVCRNPSGNFFTNRRRTKSGQFLRCQDSLTREYKRGRYHCDIDLLFNWFGISCMTTDNSCFCLQNRLIQTSQTGGQQYSDTSPFSIPWFDKRPSAN